MFKLIIMLCLLAMTLLLGVITLITVAEEDFKYDPTPCFQRNLQYTGYYNDSVVVCNTDSPLRLIEVKI